MSEEPTPPTDLSSHRLDTERNLVIGGFLLMFVVGGGLVWVMWGQQAFITSVLCLGGGVGLMALIYFILKWMEIMARRNQG